MFRCQTYQIAVFKAISNSLSIVILQKELSAIVKTEQNQYEGEKRHLIFTRHGGAEYLLSSGEEG